MFVDYAANFLKSFPSRFPSRSAKTVVAYTTDIVLRKKVLFARNVQKVNNRTRKVSSSL